MRAEYTAAALRINVRTDADIETAVEEGRCLKADTIDELLAQIEGIDVETAKASIDRYNELAKAGGGTDFFKSSQRLFALENGPFYAAECGCALTLGNLGASSPMQNATCMTRIGKSSRACMRAALPRAAVSPCNIPFR